MSDSIIQTKRKRSAATGTIRLADVAKAAAVSTATVSRVLNGKKSVAPELKERVETAIARLEWVPNPSAKALATNKTRTIGAVIPTLDHQNFARAVEHLEAALSASRYKLLLGCSRYDDEVEFRQVETMVERGVDAIIVIGSDKKEKLHDFLERNKILCINLYSRSPTLKRGLPIFFNNYGSAKEAARYLCNLGHRHFGLIGHGRDNNDRLSERKRGTEDELADQGIVLPKDHVIDSEWRIPDGIAGLRRLMRSASPPTAIVCSNDYVAFGCLLEAAHLRIRVPEDVSIIGFDDIEIAGLTDPRLTTMRIPDAEIGEMTAKYVVDLLENRQTPPPSTQVARLIVRESAAPPREN